MRRQERYQRNRQCRVGESVRRTKLEFLTSQVGTRRKTSYIRQRSTVIGKVYEMVNIRLKKF